MENNKIIKEDMILSPLDKNPFNNYLDSFLFSQDVMQNSRETYRRALKQFVKWFAQEGIASPTRETILAYKAYLESKKLSSLSISAYLVAVRKFFEWTEGKKYYPNIAKGIKGLKHSEGFRKDPLTIAQIKDLLGRVDRSTIQGKRDYALLNLLIRTGLRTIEITRSNIGDIRQEGDITLLYIQGKGRTDKEDFVLLSDEVLNPLREYLQSRNKNNNSSPLFCSLSDRNRDERLTTRSIRGIVKQHLRMIGINTDRITAHSLRHTFGVMSIKAGVPLYDIQLAMRHANPATTEIYLKSIERERRIQNSPEQRINTFLRDNGIN